MILFFLCLCFHNHASPPSIPIPLRNIIHTTLESNKQGVEHRINLDATEYSANEVIVEKTLQLTGTPNTVLIPLSEPDQSPLLTAQNSSLRIVSMTLSCCGRCVWLENSSATLFGTRLVLGSSGSGIFAVSSCVELLSTTFVPSPSRLFPSLVETVSTDCFVGLHELALEDGIVCGDEPLLASKETSSVLSSNNKMWNMTHTTRFQPHTMSETARKTHLISTELEAVDDPFYGSIVAHINTGGEFLFSNSSFNSIVGNAVSDITCPAEGCTTRQGYFTTSSLTVLNCAFIGCLNAGAGGSFHYDYATGVFTCQDSNFTYCVSGVHGGGFALGGNSKSTITRNQFTNCHAVVAGGGTFVNSGTTSMTITDCPFVGCQGNHGSGLHRNVAGPSTTISGLTFDDCKSICGPNFDEIGACGAFYLHLSEITQVSSCSVKNTLLGLDGAAISCYISSGCSLSFSDLLIEGSIPQCPDWMEEEIYTASLSDLLLSNLIDDISLPRLTVTPHGVFFGTAATTTGNAHGCTVRLASYFDGSQSAEAQKWYAIGIPSTTSSPFQTVSGSTRVMWDLFALDCSAATEIALADVNGGSFAIRSVEMSFAMNTFQQDLVSVADGELTVKNVSLGQLSLSGKSFFVLSGGSSASMTDVTVLGITQNGIGGNGVFARLSDTSALWVSSSAFTGVSSVDDGGVLFSTSSGGVSLTSCSFSSCSCGVSSHGKIAHISTTSFSSDSFNFADSSIISSGSSGLSELFFSGADIASLAQSTILGSLLIEYDDVTESNVALVFGENGSTSGPLPYFVHPHISGKPVCVSTGFWDHSDCGLEKLPCASFAHAWSRVTAKDDVVTLLTSSTMNKKVESPSCGAELSSNAPSGGRLTLTLDVSAQFSVKDGDLDIANIILLLPSSLAIPVFVVDGKTLTLSSTATIQNPSSVLTHSAALLSLASGSILVDSTSFDFASSFESTEALIEHRGGSLEMTEVSVANVTRTSGNGAIMNSILSASSSFTLSSCSFSSCHTQSGDGGVIWISCPALFPSTSLVIDASFTSCSCDNDHKGKWVFVQGHSFGSLLDPVNWASTIASLTTPENDSLLMGEDLAESEGSSFRSLSLLFYLVDFKGSTITTGSDGRNAKGCGQSTLPCSSVDEAWLHLKDSPRILKISSSSQLNLGLTLNEADVELKSASGTGTLRMGKSGGFILSTHSLIATSLSFVPVVASETRDSSLFSVVGGSLTMTSCSFTDFSLSSQPLIEHTGKSLKMDDVEFDRIVRVNGEGSVLESEMTSEMELDLNNIGLTDVSSSNEKCDGISVRFGSKTSPLANPQFKLTNLHFSTSSTTSSNTEKTGLCFLWIEGDDLGSIIFEGDSRFEGSYSEDVLDGWMWTEDWTTTLSCSLLFYLREKKGPVGLDTLGRESPHCGFFIIWCPTLPSAVSRLASSESSTVQVQSSIVLSDSVTFSSMRMLCGVDSESTVTIESTCSFSVSESSAVITISSLRILLPTSIDSTQLFDVTGGTLQISSCSFSPLTELPFSFGLICGSGEQVILESTNVSSASLSSVPLISSSCSISISHSRFSSIVLSEGDGCVINSAISSISNSLKLSACTFSDCSSAGDGGCIAVTVTAGSLLISHSSFSRCSSLARGGALLMDFSNLISFEQYKLDTVSFGRGDDKNMAATFGNDVFVIGRNLESQIVASQWEGSFSTALNADLMGSDSVSGKVESLLKYLVGDEVFVSSSGDDMNTGTEEHPFKTLGGLFSTMMNVNNVVILTSASIGGKMELGVGEEEGREMIIRGQSEGCSLLCSVSQIGTQLSTLRSFSMLTLRTHTLSLTGLALTSFSAPSGISSVFSVSSKGILKLVGCSLNASNPTSLSLVVLHRDGSAQMDTLTCHKQDFAGKGSVVLCGSGSSLEIEKSTFESTNFDSGSVVVGTCTKRISISNSTFLRCHGRCFGSLIRVLVLGSAVTLKNIRFESCSTTIRLSEQSGKDGVVGGGCVVVELKSQSPSSDNHHPTSVDLTGSSFISCSLTVTDTASSSLDLVGGSGFLIRSTPTSNSLSAILCNVTLSNCSITPDFSASTKSFSGGVIVSPKMPLQTDRRGMVVTGCSCGAVQISPQKSPQTRTSEL
ncbi:hypothetical protein BLNAU_16239 [Blattamonas nauphoetae]|uniref:Uncharacterized protein n=1 Tax=Blattamonas nauphoetae TaxID=2049346 RepID=A0ABQ9XD46_9EUKA|nr:hypothetical protein BLNAU_16239 [Blattamonas nauphoetae]